MSRMGREFTLVLLGAGVLTGGYLMASSTEEEMQKEAETKSSTRVGGSGYHGHYVPLIFAHSRSYSGSSTGRPYAATAGVTRGGIGSMGHAATGGG